MTAFWLLAAAVLALLVTIGGWLRARRALARERARLTTASQELERLQHAFARFAPEEVVERIIATGVSTTGERKEVTVLFADLVGFTALSERIEATLLVRILNGYFERMTRAIRDHQGHVSTLLGDGILALFGAIEPNPWHTNDAAHAALAMRRELEDYNRTLAAEGLPELAFGIGLHRGVGVAGLVGSRDLLEFTVIGTVVNLAARVQGLTRDHSVDVLVTADVAAALDPRFEVRPLPAMAVKGIPGPVATSALLRHRAPGE